MEEAPYPTSSSTSDRILGGKYELGRLLGRGTFAKVRLARHLLTLQPVAIKIFDKSDVLKTNTAARTKREISTMKKLSHPNIVKLREVLASKTKIFFVMDLVRGGDLFSEISRIGRLGEDVAKKYFFQIISAVEFCHSRGVFHRDLKLENILLDESKNIKIADFGLSASAVDIRSDGLLHTACGTPAYVAPEVMRNRGYDGAKSDVWSCGVILYVMLAGFLPFRDPNVVAMYRKMQRGDVRFPPWFSVEARRLVSGMLDPNPMKRISMDEILETSWFKDFERNSLEREGREREEEREKGRVNAFHIISLSSGLDLSGMFEEGSGEKERERGVMMRLESVVKEARGMKCEEERS